MCGRDVRFDVRFGVRVGVRSRCALLMCILMCHRRFRWMCCGGRVGRSRCQHGRCGAHMCEQRAHSACGVRGALVMCVLTCHRRFWWRMCCGADVLWWSFGSKSKRIHFLGSRAVPSSERAQVVVHSLRPTDTNLLATPDTIGGSIFLDREQCQVLSVPELLRIVPSTPTVGNTARTIVASQRGCQPGCCGGQKK